MDTMLFVYNGTFTSISLLLYSLSQSRKGLTKEWGRIFSSLLIFIHSVAALLAFFVYVDIGTDLTFSIILLDVFGIAVIHYMIFGFLRIQMKELRSSEVE